MKSALKKDRVLCGCGWTSNRVYKGIEDRWGRCPRCKTLVTKALPSMRHYAHR